MPRGQKRTIGEVIASFRPYIGQKGTPVIRVDRLNEVACRWHLDSIDEHGYAELSHPNGERFFRAHVLNLTIAPVASRGASGPIAPPVAVSREDREKRLAEQQAKEKAAAEASINARNKK